MLCDHCHRRQRKGERFCSKTCRRAAKRGRYQRNHVPTCERFLVLRALSGEPDAVMVVEAHERLAGLARVMRKQQRKAGWKGPWARFLTNTDAATRRKVSADPDEQAQARALVAAGWVAYQSRSGLIRDIAPPTTDEVRGDVWSRAGEPLQRFSTLQVARRYPLAVLVEGAGLAR